MLPHFACRCKTGGVGKLVPSGVSLALRNLQGASQNRNMAKLFDGFSCDVRRLCIRGEAWLVLSSEKGEVNWRCSALAYFARYCCVVFFPLIPYSVQKSVSSIWRLDSSSCACHCQQQRGPGQLDRWTCLWCLDTSPLSSLPRRVETLVSPYPNAIFALGLDAPHLVSYLFARAEDWS